MHSADGSASNGSQLMDAPTRNFTNGTWVDADHGGTIAVTNPATDEVLAHVPDVGRAEAKRAINAAAAAFPAWRRRPASERAELLRQLARLMKRDTERLARIMTLEQGKPLKEAKGEIVYAACFLEWSAGEAVRISGETIPASTTDKRLLVLRQPVGVCAMITPWNFPSAMITRKIGPALAVGCTVICKPAELTPLSALALAALAEEAGFPAGTINIITGDAATLAEEFFNHSAVRKVSFTGSTEVGRLLMKQGATNLLRLSLELGGHAPFIVFDDADIESAVRGAMASKFRNAGQTCICANRFYIQEGVAEEFITRFAQAMSELRVGNGLTEGIDLGPLINDDAIAKVESHVRDALRLGATLRAGGQRVAVTGGADRFFAPTLLDGMTPDMRCAQEETFGPVAPIARFRTEDDAIRLANDSPYGLAAYFYTRDASRAWRLADALDYGVVGINDGLPSTAQAPFGGMKHSGFGREGGHEGMREYLETKYLSWGI